MQESNKSAQNTDKKNKFFALLYKAIIEPINSSKKSINEIAFGVAIGLFIGLTPTVGMQMYLVWILWYIVKMFSGFNFDVVSATALVWISNPFTVVFLYYAFYSTGVYLLGIFSFSASLLDFETFKNALSSILENHDLIWFDKIISAGHFLLIELGWPTVFGCLFYATPFSIMSFFWTKRYMQKRRGCNT